MRIIPALIGAGLVVGVTNGCAQTAPAPTATTNPNTKVYAYQKTAPTKPRRPLRLGTTAGRPRRTSSRIVEVVGDANALVWRKRRRSSP
jgi:hypothetical protein